MLGVSGHPDDCWLHDYSTAQKRVHKRLHDTIRIAEGAVHHAKVRLRSPTPRSHTYGPVWSLLVC